MNAPLSVQIENLEVYSDLLGKEFIKETLDRHKCINESRQLSRESVNCIKKNISGMVSETKIIGDSFDENASTFNRLSLASREASEACRQLSISAKRLQESLQKQR